LPPLNLRIFHCLCYHFAPSSAPPFPYTTLFRSPRLRRGRERLAPRVARRLRARPEGHVRGRPGTFRDHARPAGQDARDLEMSLRSEEHTSELQSQSNIVCRLLLEKKN